jgi:hypothetical protein
MIVEPRIVPEIPPYSSSKKGSKFSMLKYINPPKMIISIVPILAMVNMRLKALDSLVPLVMIHVHTRMNTTVIGDPF